MRDWLKLGVTLPEPGGKEVRDKAFTKLEELSRYTVASKRYSAMVEQLLAEETGKLLEEYAAYLPSSREEVTHVVDAHTSADVGPQAAQ